MSETAPSTSSPFPKPRSNAIRTTAMSWVGCGSAQWTIDALLLDTLGCPAVLVDLVGLWRGACRDRHGGEVSCDGPCSQLPVPPLHSLRCKAAGAVVVLRFACLDMQGSTSKKPPILKLPHFHDLFLEKQTTVPADCTQRRGKFTIL